MFQGNSINMHSCVLNTYERTYVDSHAQSDLFILVQKSNSREPQITNELVISSIEQCTKEQPGSNVDNMYMFDQGVRFGFVNL